MEGAKVGRTRQPVDANASARPIRGNELEIPIEDDRAERLDSWGLAALEYAGATMGCCSSRARVYHEDTLDNHSNGRTGMSTKLRGRSRRWHGMAGSAAHTTSLDRCYGACIAGNHVVLRENNLVVAGSGSVLSSATLMQDRVHFEVEVIKPGAPCSMPPRILYDGAIADPSQNSVVRSHA